MNLTFHFIRPFWLLSIAPLIGLGWLLIQQSPARLSWQNACDAHLLPHLLIKVGQNYRKRYISLLLTIIACFILSLSGPSFSRLPTPVYQQQSPHVFLLDVSNTMLAQDLTPNRLQRAKFKLHDLLMDTGPFALIAYTSEPFVVSPLTKDGQTIETLLPSLTPDIMPVSGNRLDLALQEAKKLIEQSGQTNGQILVLSSERPSSEAINIAQNLAHEGIYTSVLPILRQPDASFSTLANAGQGSILSFSDTSTDIKQWQSFIHQQYSFKLDQHDTIPIWRDDGRWFLIPACLLLLLLFQRHWFQRIRS